MSREQERELRILNQIQSCRHFNGIQHEVCKANVNYRSQVGGLDFGWAVRLPCKPPFRGNEDVVRASCPQFSAWTEPEARQHEEALEKAVRQFLIDIANGICPHCRQSVKQRQVGHCVYGVPCGHRMYQGKVNPDYAATNPQGSKEPGGTGEKG